MPFELIDENNVVPLRSFNDNRFIFEEAETPADGLGPVYNGQSCVECHQNVVTGGASQVAEHRSGRAGNGQFFRSTRWFSNSISGDSSDIVERATFADSMQTLRISTNTLRSGFIESPAGQAAAVHAWNSRNCSGS